MSFNAFVQGLGTLLVMRRCHHAAKCLKHLGGRRDQPGVGLTSLQTLVQVEAIRYGAPVRASHTTAVRVPRPWRMGGAHWWSAQRRYSPVNQRAAKKKT